MWKRPIAYLVSKLFYRRLKTHPITIFCLPFLLIAFTSKCSYPANRKQPYTFIFEGDIKYQSVLPEISRATYISFSELSRIYNLSYSFKPVSGKAILRAYNRGIEFTINSEKYTSFDSTRKRLTNPTRLIKNKLHIPLDFISSKDFSTLTETETLYYPDNRTFIISVKTNISPARFYSLGGEITKIIIETTDKDNIIRPSTKFSGGKITLEYPRGKTLEESIAVQDGLVSEIRHSNARSGRSAFIEIFLTENARPKPVIDIKDDGITEIIIERAKGAAIFTSTPSLATGGDVNQLSEVSTVADVNISSPPRAVIPDTSTFYETPSDVNFMAGARTPKERPVHVTKTSKQKMTAAVKEQTLRAPKIRIVLDAGHGGEDPGAIGPNGTMEKDINLAIVKELERLFTVGEDAEKIEVFLTRESDVFVPLVDRTNFANEKSADLFISIHCNASMKRTTGGYEVYFLSENASDPDAIATQILENSVIELEKKPDKKRSKLQELLWSMIVNEFINESSELCYLTTLEIPKRIKVENRGVKQAGFYVLRGAQMPAILVECAFLSNAAEEAKLKNPRIQKQIADGLYTAIKNYLKTKGRI